MDISGAPTPSAMNHLLFANDNMLLFKSSVEGANAVSNLLRTYCDASGQRINTEKSSIFFSKGCPAQLRETIKANLHVLNESLSERYLGMPMDVGHSKNGTFKYLRDRVWEKNQRMDGEVTVCSRERGLDQINRSGNTCIFYVLFSLATGFM